MSKNFEDMTKEEKIQTLEGTNWYTVGRASMLEELSIMFVNRAGDCFKRGNDG